MYQRLFRIVCDDWEVLYDIDRKMICQGHEILWDEWFKVGQKNPNAKMCSIYLTEKDQDEFDLWDFPVYFDNLPEAIRSKISC